MAVRLLTKDLLPLLNDLVLTAATEAGLAGCAGILLHTATVKEGSEPGGTNCLIGTSTNGVVIGHCWTEAANYLAPTLLPIRCVHALRVSLGKLINKDNRATHITNLRRAGEAVEFSEDADLFEEGFKQRFTYGDLDDWPRSVFSLLATTYLVPPADMRPAENRTDYPVARLEPFMKIATRRRELISLFRPHQQLNVGVQIGHQYRGLLVPSGWWNDGSAEGRSPEVGVYAAPLPPLSVPAEPEPALV